MTDAASYVFAETAAQNGAPLVFTFHGTGGSEAQFHGLPGAVLADAHVISPRGDVSENGALRFFRRAAEGVYDMADLDVRSAAMAGFVAAHKARLGAGRVIGLGYSNGANILAAVTMRAPDLFTDVILMHPLIPWDPEPQPRLAGVRVLVTSGDRDPICPTDRTQALAGWYADQGAQVDRETHPGGHEIARCELAAIGRFLTG